MRSILFNAASIAALMTASPDAFAQGANTDQYCVAIHGNRNTLRCGYETLGACMEATNSGEGTCVESPFRHYRYSRYYY